MRKTRKRMITRKKRKKTRKKEISEAKAPNTPTHPRTISV